MESDNIDRFFCKRGIKAFTYVIKLKLCTKEKKQEISKRICNLGGVNIKTK